MYCKCASYAAAGSVECGGGSGRFCEKLLSGYSERSGLAGDVKGRG